MGGMYYKSLPERTADVICDMLYRENYQVGAKLPNELRLAEILEVSRSTVRQAIRILTEKNILDVRRGSGTFVSAKLGMSDDPLGITSVCDKRQLVRDLLALRLLIEPRMAALAAENRTTAEAGQLCDICDRLEAAWRDGKNYCELDMEFHTFIAGCSRNLVVHHLLPTICRTIILEESVAADKLGEQTVRAHQRICEAIVGRRASEASDAMTVHLIHNQERILKEQK